MIIFDLLIKGSGYIAFFVTDEYLWTKEHNDLMLFYLRDGKVTWDSIGYSWIEPNITKHYPYTAMHYLEYNSTYT